MKFPQVTVQKFDSTPRKTDTEFNVDRTAATTHRGAVNRYREKSLDEQINMNSQAQFNSSITLLSEEDRSKHLLINAFLRQTMEEGSYKMHVDPNQFSFRSEKERISMDFLLGNGRTTKGRKPMKRQMPTSLKLLNRGFRNRFDN